MWREKIKDMEIISDFIDNIETFHRLKEVRFERIDEGVQMAINPGTPGEDWIIPPDEGKVEEMLRKDPDYMRLRKQLVGAIEPLKDIALFLHFNEHHDFDWVNFASPLIGNAALQDGLAMARRLLKTCEEKNYPFQNLVNLFRLGNPGNG